MQIFLAVGSNVHFVAVAAEAYLSKSNSFISTRSRNLTRALPLASHFAHRLADNRESCRVSFRFYQPVGWAPPHALPRVSGLPRGGHHHASLYLAGLGIPILARLSGGVARLQWRVWLRRFLSFLAGICWSFFGR